MLGFDYGYSLDCPDGLIAGRRSSGISSTPRRSSSTNSSPAPKTNGTGSAAWCCCCRTALKARGRNIPARAWSAFSPWARRTTSRSSARAPRAIFSLPAPPGHAQLAQAAGGHDAQEPVARPALRFDLAAMRGGKNSSASFPILAGRRKVRRVLLCSGKIYYELLATTRSPQARGRRHHPRWSSFILCTEAGCKRRSRRTPRARRCCGCRRSRRTWARGASFRARFGERSFGFPFGGIRRPASASPATGSARIHKRDQKYLVAQAFPEDAP